MFAETQLAVCPIGDGSLLTLRAARMDSNKLLPDKDHSHNLASEDWTRAERYVNQRAARQFLGSHHLLNETLREALGASFHPEQISRDSLGKPFLPGQPVHFSLSRSQDYAAVGLFRTRALGIDIETRIDLATAEEIAGRILCVQELRTWGRLADSVKAATLTRYWCLKEAILKASGEGLTRDPREICISLEETSCRPTALPYSYGGVERWLTGQTVMENGFPTVYWAVGP